MHDNTINNNNNYYDNNCSYTITTIASTNNNMLFSQGSLILFLRALQSLLVKYFTHLYLGKFKGSTLSEG